MQVEDRRLLAEQVMAMVVMAAATGPDSILDEENSMPEFFRRISQQVKRERPLASSSVEQLPPPLPKNHNKKKVKTHQQQHHHQDEETPSPYYDFTSRLSLVPNGYEDGLYAIFLSIGDKRKQQWLRDPALTGRNDPPNKKYSCKQYTAEFVDWINAMATAIVATSGGGRTFRMTIGGEEQTFEGLSNKPEGYVYIPTDNRCMGCRRYFVTQDQTKCKELAFHVCNCKRRRASYCIRCRCIQWALALPLPGGEPEIPSVGCVGCQEPWSPATLFILSVTK
jgi:hypothetical protein